jgi:hypothetical protein
LYVSSDGPVRHEVPPSRRKPRSEAGFSAAIQPARTWQYYVPMHQAHGKLVMPNPVVIVPVIPATGHAGSAPCQAISIAIQDSHGFVV